MRFKKDEEFISEVEIKPKTELEQVTKSCFIVFSSKEEHVENVIDSIEMVIKDKYDFTVKRLDKEIGSDESQYETILDLLKECSFGIAILDGLRPNVMFEYGLLKGLGKPVMVFKEKNASIDVRNFYIDKSKNERERIENPKIDYDKHLSDIKDRNYKEYDKNNLRDFRQILDDDFVKHKQDIINEIRRMMTPKGIISEEGLMSEQLNVIANKLAKTAKELIDQDEVEIDQTVKIIDNLAKEFRVEMPSEYYFGLGNIYSNRQKYEKAIVYYDILLERNPEDSVAYVSKGRVLSHLGRFSEALACIDKALEIDQKDAKAWDIRALSLFELGKLDDAIKSHDKALELDQKEWVFWYNKGVTLSFSGMNEEAIECYNKALEINPRIKSALINKCIALHKIGRFDEELKCIDKGLERYPKDAEFWNFKSRTFYDLSKFDDVLVCINKALEIEPENYGFLGNKAVILHKLGRTDDALECIDKALKINQKDAGLWYQKGRITKDFNEAIKCFDKALEFDPDLVEALCDKGSNLSNIGKYDEAMKIFDEVEKKCEKYDNCETISMKKGITLSKMGKSKEAIKHFNKALKLNPEDADSYISRAIAYRKLKQYEKEQEDYKRALEFDPNHIHVMQNFSELYILTKNYEGAQEMAKRTLNIAEEDNDIIISHFLMVCSSLLQNKKEDAKNQLNRLMDYRETIKDWTLTWDFSDIKQAIESSDADENVKSLMLSLVELLENKITLDEFKNLFLAVK
jgi:tetratricopeptide (TPR) repeat protein